MKGSRVVLISLYSSDAIGPRYISSFLKKHGVDVNIIFFKEKFLETDIMSLPTEREYELLIDLIKKCDPDIVGLSLRSSFFNISVLLTSKIKEHIDKPVIWGGTHPTIAPDDCITVADMICIGEGEYPMLELAQRICDGHDISNIQNLWLRRENEIVKNPLRQLNQDLDALPFPDYGSSGKYFIENNSVNESDPVTEAFNLNVMTSRGCPYNCAYCSNSVFIDLSRGKGPLVRRRSVNNVIEEIETMREIFPNLMRVDFIDEVFAWDKTWTSEFRKKYKERINLPFQCAQHPNMITEDILRYLVESGLERVSLGIQSGSERIRREIYGRPVTDEILLRAGKILRDANIVPMYDLIVDNPFETDDDLRAGLEFLLKLPRPYHMRMFPLTYFPNTKLTKMAIKAGKITEEQVENKAERTHSKWFVTLDYPWPDRERYWISLYALTSKSFVPRKFIRWLSEISFFNTRPKILSFVATLANNIKLGTIAIRWLIEGKSFRDVFRQSTSKQSHWQV